MTYHKEYTLHNGQKIYVEYNEYNVCQVTKDCIEMLLDSYKQGRVDAIDEAKSVILQTIDNEILVDTLHLRLEQLKERNNE